MVLMRTGFQRGHAVQTFSVGLNTSRLAVDIKPHLIDTADEAEWTTVLCNRVGVLARVVCGVSPGRPTQAHGKLLSFLNDVLVPCITREAPHCNAVTCPSVWVEVQFWEGNRRGSLEL